MGNQYPFTDKVRARLEELDDPEKTLNWLAQAIGRSYRWFYQIDDFTKIPFGLVQDISKLLSYNFPEDYNLWLLKNEKEAIYAPAALSQSTVNEPAAEYKRLETKTSITITLMAPVSTMHQNLGILYKEIADSAAKNGFELR